MNPRGNRRRTAVLALSAMALTSAFLGSVHAAPTIGVPASVTEFDAGLTQAIYDGVDFGKSDLARDDRSIQTTWRVIERTGNCCENYLTTTADGTLVNFGSQYLAYTKDRGQTWRQVKALAPMLQGEGAVVAAPDGDILGVSWDLDAADQVQAYKYEADTDEWYHQAVPLHSPYYDREWIGVVPGPVTILGQTHPYVALLRERLNRNWHYSTDGLNYLPLATPELQSLQALGAAVHDGPLPTTPDPVLDWVQTNANTGIIPLGGGRALAAPGLPGGLSGAESFAYSLLDGETFTWSPHALPSSGDSRFQVDSAGRLHNVQPREDGSGFAYRISEDGGLSWLSEDVTLPAGKTIGDGCCALGGPGVHRWDFRANLAAGVGAVAIRAHDSTTSTEQDLVYKFDITGESPRLARLLRVGLGDTAAAQSPTGTGARMDFGSLTIFADGKVAVSFLDSTTRWTGPGTRNDPYEVQQTTARGASPGPAIAIEGDTGPVEPARITVAATQQEVQPSPLPGNTTEIIATVVDDRGKPVVGAPVTFSFLKTGSGAYPLYPTLSAGQAVTDRLGQASVTYTSGPLPTLELPAVPQTDVIEVHAGYASTTITIRVTSPVA